MQKITPFLWFDNNAEEALNFYTSVFKDAKIISVHRSGPKGAVMTGTIEIRGQRLMVLNGGPMYKFTPAISLFVSCKTQEEVDYLWEKLSKGGRKDRCGWLQDKFGLSWQIIPDTLGELLYNSDPVKSQKAMRAMMKMTKIDISALKAAAEE